MRSFGDRLRQLRVAAGLTQTALGTLAGVYEGDVSRIESGKKDPRESTQHRLLEAIDLDRAETRLRRHLAVIEAERARRR